MRKSPRTYEWLWLLALVAASGHCQDKPAVQQKAERSTCSNIIALAGNVDVDCSSLAPDEQKIIDGLPAVLTRILKQRIQPNVVLRKLDEIQASMQDLKQNPPDPNRGVLFPANDPNPFVDDWCETNIPKDWYRLYLGSFIVASPGFPLGGIVIRGKQVLGFRQHDGGIGITATVSSPDGKRVVFMKDNYFKLDDFFRRETPDKSTLNVFNETDDEPVLHVRYLNPKAILVTGKFSEQGLTVIIDNQEIKTDSPHSNHYRGGCGTASESGFLFN